MLKSFLRERIDSQPNDGETLATINPSSSPGGIGSFGEAFVKTARVNCSMASQSADNFHADVPGIVCGFSLDDFTSKRGNGRGGFFSTLLPWRKLES